MEIRSPYDGSNVVERVGGGDSMTRESFAAELDINTIVARYAAGGQLPQTTADARYGDASEVRDYKSALDFVFESKDQINDLPAAARAQLIADPHGYYARLDAAEDRESLVGLGLLAPLPDEPEEPIVEPVIAPVVPPAV